ncbi:MAG: hypothetical protein KDD60_02690 [Bdellovibrionales bacterium]|nr:hypothetical protein [Bdellovibrionales bacterium]
MAHSEDPFHIPNSREQRLQAHSMLHGARTTVFSLTESEVRGISNAIDQFQLYDEGVCEEAFKRDRLIDVIGCPGELLKPTTIVLSVGNKRTPMDEFLDSVEKRLSSYRDRLIENLGVRVEDGEIDTSDRLRYFTSCEDFFIPRKIVMPSLASYIDYDHYEFFTFYDYDPREAEDSPDSLDSVKRECGRDSAYYELGSMRKLAELWESSNETPVGEKRDALMSHVLFRASQNGFPLHMHAELNAIPELKVFFYLAFARKDVSALSLYQSVSRDYDEDLTRIKEHIQSESPALRTSGLRRLIFNAVSDFMYSELQELEKITGDQSKYAYLFEHQSILRATQYLEDAAAIAVPRYRR